MEASPCRMNVLKTVFTVAQTSLLQVRQADIYHLLNILHSNFFFTYKLFLHFQPAQLCQSGLSSVIGNFNMPLINFQPSLPNNVMFQILVFALKRTSWCAKTQALSMIQLLNTFVLIRKWTVNHNVWTNVIIKKRSNCSDRNWRGRTTMF